jgi:hypothetical protein
MKCVAGMTMGLVLAMAVACNGDDGDDKSTALTAPASLKVSTVEGKPHLTWTDAANEEMYMIERMDGSMGGQGHWATVQGADNLVPNTVAYHDTSADPAKTYMYRVMAMKGEEMMYSNEVSWP